MVSEYNGKQAVAPLGLSYLVASSKDIKLF